MTDRVNRFTELLFGSEAGEEGAGGSENPAFSDANAPAAAFTAAGSARSTNN